MNLIICGLKFGKGFIQEGRNGEPNKNKYGVPIGRPEFEVSCQEYYPGYSKQNKRAMLRKCSVANYTETVE